MPGPAHGYIGKDDPRRKEWESLQGTSAGGDYTVTPTAQPSTSVVESSYSGSSGSTSTSKAPTQTATSKLKQQRKAEEPKAKKQAKPKTVSLAESIAKASKPDPLLRNRVTPSAKKTQRQEFKSIGKKNRREAAFRKAGRTSGGLLDQGTGDRIAAFGEGLSMFIPGVGATVKTARVGGALGPAIVKAATKTAAKAGINLTAQDRLASKVAKEISRSPEQIRLQERLDLQAPRNPGTSYVQHYYKKTPPSVRQERARRRYVRDRLDWEFSPVSKGKNIDRWHEKEPPTPYTREEWDFPDAWAGQPLRNVPADATDLRRKVGGKQMAKLEDDLVEGIELDGMWYEDTPWNDQSRFAYVLRDAADQMPEVRDAVAKQMRRDKAIERLLDLSNAGRHHTGDAGPTSGRRAHIGAGIVRAGNAPAIAGAGELVTEDPRDRSAAEWGAIGMSMLPLAARFGLPPLLRKRKVATDDDDIPFLIP